jgi:hypothetical protein
MAAVRAAAAMTSSGHNIAGSADSAVPDSVPGLSFAELRAELRAQAQAASITRPPRLLTDFSTRPKRRVLTGQQRIFAIRQRVRRLFWFPRPPD